MSKTWLVFVLFKTSGDIEYIRHVHLYEVHITKDNSSYVNNYLKKSVKLSVRLTFKSQKSGFESCCLFSCIYNLFNCKMANSLLSCRSIGIS